MNKERRAEELCKELHQYQFRKNKKPYWTHPIAVRDLLVKMINRIPEENRRFFSSIEDMCIAALLHDVLEDTTYPEQHIGQEFGEKVLIMVKALTKQEGMSLEDYYRNLSQISLVENKGADIILIKCADILNNTLDFPVFTKGIHQHISESDIKWMKKNYEEKLKGLNIISDIIFTNTQHFIEYKFYHEIYNIISEIENALNCLYAVIKVYETHMKPQTGE